MARTKVHRVLFDHDEDGFWTVTVPDFPGCITQAKTLDQGMRRAREALGLLLDDKARVRKMTLVPDFKLDKQTARLLSESRAARAAAEAATARAGSTTRELVRKLVEDLGLSLRDAAQLVGVSFQRVQQLAAERA